MKFQTDIFAKMKPLDKEHLSFSLERKKAYVISGKFFGIFDLTDYLIADGKEVLSPTFSVSNEFFLPLCVAYPDGLSYSKSGTKDSFFHETDKLKIPTAQSLVDAELESTLEKLFDSSLFEDNLIFDLTPFVAICKEAQKFGHSGLYFNQKGIASRSAGKVYVYLFTDEYCTSPGADKVSEFFLPFEFIPFLELSSKVHARVSPEGQITLLLFKEEESVKPYAAFSLAIAMAKDNRVDVATNFALHDYTNNFVSDVQPFKDFMYMCKPVLANKDQIIPMDLEISKTSVRLRLTNSNFGIDLDVEALVQDIYLSSEEIRVLQLSAVQFEKVLTPFTGQVTFGFYDMGDKKTHLILSPITDSRKFIIISQIVKRG